MADKIKIDNRFVGRLSAAFPDYEFDDLVWRGKFGFIAVKHRGVQLGRISLRFENKEYSIFNIKFYKPVDYSYEFRDRFFYLFPVWIRTGSVPRIDFDKLVRDAKMNRKQRTESIKEQRRRNPKRRFEAGADGIRVIEFKRRVISRCWMKDFRKLVAYELAIFEACNERIQNKMNYKLLRLHLDNNNESEDSMRIYNARHEQKNERKKFISLRAGDIFIYRGCVVMLKLDSPLHRVVPNGDSYALEQVNAIRLGRLDDAEEGARIAGKPSVISNESEVEVIDRNVAGLYLRG